MVEDKDHPFQSGPLEFEDLFGNTVGLILRMMNSYFATCRYVIIDYGFCVLKGLIQLRKKGVFDCAVIKKIRYWPYVVPGKEMEDHFWKVEVGDTYDIEETVYDVIYHIWRMKEPYYVMRMMDTRGDLLADDICKETIRIWNNNGEDVVKKYKYKLPFDWNFRYHHTVDDHNNLRNVLPSIEDT